MERNVTEPPVWIERLRICSYDVDCTRRATGVSLCRYFLEAAWNHAEELGVGFGHLRQQGRYWVLSRLAVELVRPPAWGSAATLRTWPRSAKSVFALRDFEVTEDSGSRLVAGSSAWLVLDLESRRPQRPHRVLPVLEGWDGPMAIGRDPEKLTESAPWDEVSTVAVRYTDVDVNRHVNSARYVGWILDAYPVAFHEAHALQRLEVNYLGETVADEVLSVHTGRRSPTVFCHSLVKARGTEVCRARLEWRRTAPA